MHASRDHQPFVLFRIANNSFGKPDSTIGCGEAPRFDDDIIAKGNYLVWDLHKLLVGYA